MTEVQPQTDRYHHPVELNEQGVDIVIRLDTETYSRLVDHILSIEGTEEEFIHEAILQKLKSDSK